MRYAREAWNFLYSDRKDYRDERWLVCALAGVDPEFLERRMALASIPEPTYETLKHAWTELELAYWRLGGQQGEKPEPRAANAKPRSRNDRRRNGNNPRTHNGFRVSPVPRRSPLPLAADRRGQTFLFNPKARPVQSTSSDKVQASLRIASHQYAFGF
jgi:hypothetical protein